MDKRILLLTDFSKNAFNAARYALDLYSGRECSFFILNTYGVDGHTIYDESPNGELGLQMPGAKNPITKERFENLLQMLRMHSENSKHKFHTISIYDSLIRGAKDVIAQNDIDIVVMGGKGMTGSRTVIFGMNTLNVMEQITECPVLAIPEDIRFTSPRDIIFPTDFKRPFKRRELKYLINIAQVHDSIIQVLYVKKRESDKLDNVQKNNKALLETLLQNVTHSFYEVEDTTVQAGIDAFIDDHNSDMVSFVHHKRNFFSRMASKPLIRKLGYQSRVPVLLLQHRT